MLQRLQSGGELRGRVCQLRVLDHERTQMHVQQMKALRQAVFQVVRLHLGVVQQVF